MAYTIEEIEFLEDKQLTIPGRCTTLVESFSADIYSDAKAREYATHGFSRRMNTLARCIENIFDILQPDLHDLPTREQRIDAAINVQAFVFNVSGSLDNLAWIWVSEKGIKHPDGKPLVRSQVGLGKRNKLVRNSLSSDFQRKLVKFDEWLDEYLTDYRDALAHRIPLYIPPYTVPTDNMAAYRDYEDRKNAAMARGDFVTNERLSNEQDALGKFKPLMIHSMGDHPARPVMIHPQILTDFATVEEVAQNMLNELGH